MAGGSGQNIVRYSNDQNVLQSSLHIWTQIAMYAAEEHTEVDKNMSHEVFFEIISLNLY